MKFAIVSNLNKADKNNFNIAIGGNYNLNKKILENKNIKLLLDPEPLEEDFMKYKNSGLNQVLAKLAKKNSIGMGFSLERLSMLSKIEKARLFGKILQNIKLCNKYNLKYYIVNFNNDNGVKDLRDLAISLKIKNINIIQEVI